MGPKEVIMTETNYKNVEEGGAVELEQRERDRHKEDTKNVENS